VRWDNEAAALYLLKYGASFTKDPLIAHAVEGLTSVETIRTLLGLGVDTKRPRQVGGLTPKEWVSRKVEELEGCKKHRNQDAIEHYRAILTLLEENQRQRDTLTYIIKCFLRRKFLIDSIASY